MAETAISVELKTMLGTEIAGAWITFMDRVYETIPCLAGRGRPSSEQIQNSEIGEAGCTSWRQYVDEVLDWNYNSWSAWVRAYAVVQNHAYLRELKLTSSQINTLYNDMKGDFPETRKAYEDIMEAAAEARRQLELANIRGLQAEVSRLSHELANEKEKNLEAREALLAYEKDKARFAATPWYRRPWFTFGG